MIHAGILLAAPSSGSGKTTIVCALLAALKKQNRKVRAFKSGPDYIDPMFHERVLHVPSRNLDTFFSDEKQLKELYDYGKEEAEISVIEGAMGLYDGLGGIRKEGSAWHLADILDLPVILVVDAHGMGQTIIPVLLGLQQYDTGGRIAGVILNRTSAGFYEIIHELIERELNIPVLGYFPEREEFQIKSRHLGLKLPDEIERLEKQQERAAEQLEESVDLKRLLEIAEKRAVQEGETALRRRETISPKTTAGERTGKGDTQKKETVRIAVAKDAAFCFYYEDNLRMLKEMGAELVSFSPLADSRLPKDTDGLVLGGGYPELYAEELSKNVSMRCSIKKAIESGMPSLAECGGFMYLHESLTVDGQTYPMAGVVAGNCRNLEKLVRFGYVEIQEKTPAFLSGGAIKGHEFHYYDSENNGNFCTAKKPVTGKDWDCVHGGQNHWWGFPHLYYPSNPAFASHFISSVRTWKIQRDEGEAAAYNLKEDIKLKHEITKRDSRAELYGIGVGPGEPELMTLKAVQMIGTCDILVLPAVSRQECYAYRIAEKVCPGVREKPVLCMPFPMIKDREKLQKAHTKIYAAIETQLKKGQRVAFMTIGDPSVYSTYMYMHKRALEAGWQARMISGVPSFCAAAARLGISLGGHTGEVHIIPASYEIADTLSYSGTRVYMKSGKKLKELILLLEQHSRKKNHEIYGISNCGMENEQVYYGLDELKKASGYLTIVIVKEC